MVEACADALSVALPIARVEAPSLRSQSLAGATSTALHPDVVTAALLDVYRGVLGIRAPTTATVPDEPAGVSDLARSSPMIEAVRRTRATLPVVGLLAACLMSGSRGECFPDGTGMVLLSLAIAAILALALVYRSTRPLDPFDPLLVFALGWMVMWVVHPLAMIESDHLSVEYSFSSINVAGTMECSAPWLGLLATVCFVGGYALPIGRLLGSRGFGVLPGA